ncbi:EAL and HDOD domain-containing protein [Legionella sp. km772]|uniref:EAL and HDOD domain-containing protein n=1 Tax=Legionella sp. km772 TaxID=2498111 RepID=UPI000F8D6706|nr:HDOD domain-containing protein [Legionella sp. km772]RUR12997.1 HDOD domain-containing protein [Legionella sp. km772]
MIVKRPIYNHQLKCVAFEILAPKQEELNDELSTHLVQLINTADADLPLFIPFELKALIEHLVPPIQNPVILKLAAEDIEAVYSPEEVQNSVFSIALLISTPQQLAWLNFAEYIGLTEQLMNQANVRKVVEYSKAKQRKVIAYGLDQPLSFAQCKDMIMDYYCGDFLFKPLLDEQIDIAANKLNLLQLIQSLQKEDCDLQKISTIIQTDPLLSYQLLRLANSAAFSGGNPITSIEQAVTRLGLINLKNWVMLFSMKNISDKPIEILESGLIRAHMAQEIAKVSTNNINYQSAYTAGLLSILDCLLNKPMAELINKITLAEDITSALLEHAGALGEVLDLVIAYESGHWEEVQQDNINGLDLSKLYIDSLSLVSNGTNLFDQ